MKKLIRAVSAIALAALFVVPAVVRAEKPDAPKDQQVTGEISAVDVKANTVTILTKKHGNKVFTVSADTKIAGEGKEKGTIANLKLGDRVTVHYTGEGDKLTATKIGHADLTKPKNKEVVSPAPATPQAPGLPPIPAAP